MKTVPLLLITLGILLVFVGLLWQFTSIKIGQLPGDLKYEGKNSSFYFPLTTSIILSIVLTLIFWAIKYFAK